jgi:glycyl-tRNA synthetase beta chain
VIRIITEKELSLALSPYLDVALKSLKPWLHKEPGKKAVQDTRKPLEETKWEVFDFILDRLQNVLADQGVPSDVSAAVLEVSRKEASHVFLNPEKCQLAERLDDLVHIRAKALALAQVKETEDFKPLAVGMKRVMNILRKEADQVPTDPADLAVMTEDAEKALYKAFQALAGEARAKFAEGEYLAFLQALSALKGPIDKFFDDVLVMDPDDKVRANRLAMLNEIAEMFRQVAEFTHLQLA